VRAWLVHLLFTDDPNQKTTAAAWDKALKQADTALTLTGVPVEVARHVLLPAGTRDELLSRPPVRGWDAGRSPAWWPSSLRTPLRAFTGQFWGVNGGLDM
jgi:hypothetical protein